MGKAKDHSGELSKRGFKEFLETILLYFEYKDERHTVALPFYERGKNSFYDLAMLERNARNWQMILSKMIMPTTEGLKRTMPRRLQIRRDTRDCVNSIVTL